MTVTRILAAAAAAALTGSAALAGDLPQTMMLAMGYFEAAPADFAGTPAHRLRLADPTGFLAASADFNGDGKGDEARILLHRERGEARILITILTDKLDTYVLEDMPLVDAADIGIRIAPPQGNAGLPGLAIFRLDGSGETRLYFDGEEFEQR